MKKVAAYFAERDFPLHVAYIDGRLHEELSHLYHVYQMPQTLLFYPSGYAYKWYHEEMTVESIVDWLSKNRFLEAPVRYKIEGILSTTELRLEYAKKFVRMWHIRLFKPSLDQFFGGLGNMHLADHDHPHQKNEIFKTDR